MVTHRPSKPVLRVQVPLSAPLFDKERQYMEIDYSKIIKYVADDSQYLYWVKNNLPVNANPMYKHLAHSRTVDLSDKYKRGVGFSVQQRELYGDICSYRSDQPITCYGKMENQQNVKYSREDLILCCSECPYSNYMGKESRKELWRDSVTFPFFIVDLWQDKILEEDEDKINDCNNFVYFITDGDYIKIGVANNLENRLSALQTSNAKELKILFSIPMKDKESAYALELFLHNTYKSKNVRGEWFDILYYIDKTAFDAYFGYKNKIGV